MEGESANSKYPDTCAWSGTKRPRSRHCCAKLATLILSSGPFLYLGERWAELLQNKNNNNNNMYAFMPYVVFSCKRHLNLLTQWIF